MNMKKTRKNQLSGRMAAHLLVLSLLMVILMSGCTKMPVSGSYWYEGGKMRTGEFSGYDNKSGLRWLVSNDDTMLYFMLETDDKNIQRNIFMSGVKLYFDTTGRKKEDVFLHFPYRQGGMSDRPDMRPVNPDDREGSQRMTLQMPTEALWKSGDSEYFMDLLLEKTNFHGEISFDSLGVLVYKVEVPLKNIFLANYNHDRDFSIGIDIGGIMRSPDMEADGFGGTQMRSGAGRPGGYPDKGQPGVGYGDPRSGQRPGRVHSSGTEIWFFTILAEPLTGND